MHPMASTHMTIRLAVMEYCSNNSLNRMWRKVLLFMAISSDSLIRWPSGRQKWEEEKHCAITFLFCVCGCVRAECGCPHLG